MGVGSELQYPCMTWKVYIALVTDDSSNKYYVQRATLSSRLDCLDCSALQSGEQELLWIDGLFEDRILYSAERLNSTALCEGSNFFHHSS